MVTVVNEIQSNNGLRQTKIQGHAGPLPQFWLDHWFREMLIVSNLQKHSHIISYSECLYFLPISRHVPGVHVTPVLSGSRTVSPAAVLLPRGATSPVQQTREALPPFPSLAGWEHSLSQPALHKCVRYEHCHYISLQWLELQEFPSLNSVGLQTIIQKIRIQSSVLINLRSKAMRFTNNLLGQRSQCNEEGNPIKGLRNIVTPLLFVTTTTLSCLQSLKVI